MTEPDATCVVDRAKPRWLEARIVAAVEVSAEHEAIVAGVALHPNEAPRLAERGELEAALAEIETLALAHEHVRAIGETGLDRFRTGEDGRAAQEESFRWHIDAAKKHDKTLVIHDRDAHSDILRVLDDEGAPERVVMHCFSGDEDFAKACVERGFWLSYPGVITFASGENLRDAALVTPIEKILIETDAPFLTPKPERGKKNAPYLMPHTVRFVAELLGADLAEFCDTVTTNTWAAYGGQWGPNA